MQKIVLATKNQGKIAEIGALLRSLQPGLEVLGLADFPYIGDLKETGQTFEENARQKAEQVAGKTGLVALADDSGLCVDALQGAPGVYSARYSGAGATDKSNNLKLLREMEQISESRRRASFVCVLVACSPEAIVVEARGEWHGFVSWDLKGESGFGYDPLFIDEQTGLRAAELKAEEKNRCSHRAKALQTLIDIWPDFCERVKAARKFKK